MKLKFLVPVILSASLYAQTGVPQKPAVTQALTELESTKLELLSTQNLLLRRQEDELKSRFNQLIADINKNHPGYEFNIQTGGLQPKQEPKKEEKK